MLAAVPEVSAPGTHCQEPAITSPPIISDSGGTTAQHPEDIPSAQEVDSVTAAVVEKGRVKSVHHGGHERLDFTRTGDVGVKAFFCPFHSLNAKSKKCVLALCIVVLLYFERVCHCRNENYDTQLAAVRGRCTSAPKSSTAGNGCAGRFCCFPLFT